MPRFGSSSAILKRAKKAVGNKKAGPAKSRMARKKTSRRSMPARRRKSY